ncbi:MAG: radical SAM protein, partial [bacterium]|nr:radical SAM protein [bacterium]
MMLKVNEIFYSIQGESTFVGLPCVFVRLTGCNLRCRYCDTSYAYFKGEEMTIAEILAKVKQFPCRLVEITGGEPLLQSGTIELCQQLIATGMTVLLETNGSCNIQALTQPIVRVIDVKCPGSGEEGSFLLSNLDDLRPTDNLKFVLSHEQDFQWALE